MSSPDRVSIFQRHPTISRCVLVGLVFVGTDLAAGALVLPERYDDFRRYHDAYHHGLLPGRSDEAHWGNRLVPYYTNSLGLRDRAPREIARATDKRRLLFMGDSFTEGVGVPYEKSFAGLVADRLAGADVEVLNGGVIGYSPRLYYLRTRFLLEQEAVELDEVFVFLDMSDVHDEVFHQSFQAKPPTAAGEFLHRVVSVLRKRSLVFHTLFNLTHGDDFDRILRRVPWFDGIQHLPEEVRALLDDGNALNDMWSRDDAFYRMLGVPGIELARENMDALLALCREHNVALSVFVYPWRAQILARDLENKQVSVWRDWCRERGVRFVNLFPLFIDSKRPTQEVVRTNFIPGDVHWNAAGHRLVAERVLEVAGGS